ncbi:MAG: type II toxin-antitoxin system RelE/ParE family toxin [Synergistales bacterium]|nr:type II toxin-antitoxin system RelE/ParE family toxin [Synergistales bacterium]
MKDRGYRVDIKNSALKALKKLDKSTRKRLSEAIFSLSAEPRPHGVRKLTGSDFLYRIRVGEYRIIYQVQDDILVVLVVRLGARSDIYRNLD